MDMLNADSVTCYDTYHTDIVFALLRMTFQSGWIMFTGMNSPLKEREVAAIQALYSTMFIVCDMKPSSIECSKWTKDEFYRYHLLNAVTMYSAMATVYCDRMGHVINKQVSGIVAGLSGIGCDAGDASHVICTKYCNAAIRASDFACTDYFERVSKIVQRVRRDNLKARDAFIMCAMPSAWGRTVHNSVTVWGSSDDDDSHERPTEVELEQYSKKFLDSFD